MFDLLYSIMETNEPIFNRLSDVSETILKNGNCRIQGRVDNLRIKQDFSVLLQKYTNVSISGSLPKFLNGDNISAFSRQDTQRAIEKLSDELSLEVKSSNIYTLEIAKSFIMDYPVRYYLNSLGDMRWFKQMTIGDQTKNYFNENKSIKFYDKIAEMKKKGQVIPEIFQGRNVLRYELKLQGRLKAAFKMQEVKAENLYSELFYIKALKLWQYFYFLIEKRNRIIFNGAAAMQSTKNFIEQLALIGVKSMGVQEVSEMLDKTKGNLSRLQYSRLKSKLKHLENIKSFTEPLETIEELNEKVNQAVLNYR